MRRHANLSITLAILVALAGCGAEESTGPADPAGPGGGNGEPVPNEPEPPRGGAPASLVQVSGGAQDARTGELTPPLVVRVLDARGIRVEGATVEWAVSKGFAGLDGDSSLTDADGEAETHVRTSGELGTIVVEASVSGVAAPVRFTINVTTLVIDIYHFGFRAPDGTTEAGLPAGAKIGFRNGDVDPHQVVSTSQPPGGQPFGSAVLERGQVYEFVPNTSGTWTFECALHDDEQGAMTVG